ncbi:MULTISPECIES: phenylacetate--CoA ligase family protein [Dyella]|uniref:Phenylacetate--CoA ligase family protein n=2 Tax=Dyella TaxID=231454 RepID=A0A4V2NKV3_9GAMM|nr:MULTISPECIES: phenylacetate--CoA ligase family protein [Dyella]TBR36179.1 phenylacetate--CoA ligase family protein [Dyella terrae]TCI06228.1 phenylacetate--CoA ligase family protein [Dyella soli]
MSGWYEAAFQRVLYPAYERGLRGRHTLDWLASYERDQWLSPEQIAALQWQRLQRLLQHAWREVPFYRQRWQAAGITPDDIRSMDDFARLPVLTKADIREHFDDLKARSERAGMLYKATGGSTGEPVRFGYTRESNDRRTAVMWRGYAWAGSRMGRRTLYLWGGAVGTPTRAHQWKDRLFNAAFARRVLNSFHMTDDNLGEYADAIEQYRPEVIVAYVGPLVRLAQWLLDQKRVLRHKPQSIVCGAEALHEFQRDIVQRAFGCHAFNTYGCREVMLIASECEHRHGLHINADHLVVELLDDQGRHASSGNVVLTDLYNDGMPLIRYVNGDMATMASHACACGRGLPLLAHVDGRVLDAIRTPDGRYLPGEFFPHLLKEVPGVQRFQLVQRRLDRLDLSIVPGSAFNADSLAFIRAEAGKVLGQEVELQCHMVDDIPLTPSGKLRVTVSELVS